MDRVEQLPALGVTMHCPDCRRQLISFNEDGSFNLAGLTVVRGSAEQTIDEYGDVEEPREMIVTDAICVRRLCRSKRWLRSHKPRRRS